MERWTSIHPQDKKAEPVNEEKPLNVVLPCWKGDEHQAIWVLDWIAEMGMVQAPFYLLCSNECDVKSLSESARKAFSMPQWLEDCAYAADEQGDRKCCFVKTIIRIASEHERMDARDDKACSCVCG